MGLSRQAKMSDTHSCRPLSSMSACLVCGNERRSYLQHGRQPTQHDLKHLQLQMAVKRECMLVVGR